MKVTAIDFETANSRPASVCSVGVATLEDGVLEDTYYSLIRPEDDVFWFSEFNTGIHGIRARDVLDAPDFYDVFRHIREAVDGSLVCAHNAKFDMGCLAAACRNCGIPLPDIRYFDTLELSRRMFPYQRHHRLNDMCDLLEIELNHHNAASDAMGCLSIVACVMERTGIYDIEELLEKTHTRVFRLTETERKRV